VHFHAQFGSTFGRDQNVAPRRRSTQRDDVWVFQQEERIRNLLPFATLDEPPLEFMRLAIRETPKLVHVADSHSHPEPSPSSPRREERPVSPDQTRVEKSVVSIVWRMWARN
jgi:hypothetical protein